VKQSKLIADTMEALIKKVRFERASFTLPGHTFENSREDTEVIRAVTRLYTETYIVPFLEAIRDGNTDMIRRCQGLLR